MFAHSLSLLFLAPLCILAQAPPSPYSSPAPASQVNDAAGASGDDNGFKLSSGVLIAIIVVAIVVGLGGVAAAVLFYLAKKRSWEIRKTVRRSARRVATAVTTPRTPNFPRGSRGVRITEDSDVSDIPPTRDLEKGPGKVTSSFDVEPPTPKTWRWSMLGFGRRGRR